MQAEFESEAPSKEYMRNIKNTLLFSPVQMTDFCVIPSAKGLKKTDFQDSSI